MNAASRDSDVLFLALEVSWRAAGLAAYSSDSSFRGEAEHLARKIVSTLGRDAVKDHFVGQPAVIQWAFALGGVEADDEEELGRSRMRT